jgi:hypothetical protein
MSWVITGSQKNKGLIDEFTGAAAAYSLRDLTFLRGGPVVRVRRSSDNAESDFTATQVSDGTLATFCGAGNGFVRTWYDQSGNGNHAINSTNTVGSRQPQIVTSGAVNLLNSKPCLTYASDAESNLNLTSRITNVASVFEVLKLSTVGGNDQNCLLGDTSEFNYLAGSTQWLSSVFASASVRNGVNKINGVVTNLALTNRSTSHVLISMIHSGTATVSAISKDRTFQSRSLMGNLQEIILYSTSQ